MRVGAERNAVIAARRRRSSVIALTVAFAAGLLPLGRPAVAVEPPPTVEAPAGPIPTAGEPGSPPEAEGGTAPGLEPGAVPEPDPPTGLWPTIHYEDALTHADDEIAFEPGGLVTTGFSPRATDRWPVGGVAPRALPAGHAEGRQMAAAAQGSTWAVRAPVGVSVGTARAGIPGDPVDVPAVDPASIVATDDSSAIMLPAEAGATATAESGVAGLRREVFGFLPYWDVNDAILHWPTLSTVAYYAVGADDAGNLLKKNGDGSTTVGWSGWTSSRMTQVINQAHANGSRVVLTATVFAWTTSQANNQRAILGSAGARANLAAQLAAAVRDRGADGVNLDFEPLVSNYEDEFVAFVRQLRSNLDAIAPGYQLTFDTMGWIGNYPLEAATAPGAADAIFIMGYDYRNGSSTTSGSISPLRGPTYDLTETVAAYKARVPASKLILGVPYYGRAWSTSTDQPRSSNISGTKYGSSASVIYSTAAAYAAEHGRRWDSTEASPWVLYRRENCTSTYGCVTSWRQIWYDDAQSLGEKYDLVNREGLRGTGIWSLGYEGSRTELRNVLAAKFRDDTTAPIAGVVDLADVQSSEAFTVRWAGLDDVGVASYDVDVAIDGTGWRRWLTGTGASAATYAGADGHTFAFRVRARDAAGNASEWGVADPAVTVAGGPLVVGGFGLVTVGSLNVRSSPSTAAAKVATANAGTILAITGGPVDAGGYRWFQVSLPIAEWPAVSDVMADVWIAEGDGGGPFVIPTTPPHVTRVASGPAPEAARFNPLAPTRILDTRTGNGLSGAFSAGTPRVFQVTGRGGVPGNAIAVTGNLTITGQTAAGYLSLGPTPTAAPQTSTLNVPKGDVRANGVTVRLGAGGTLALVYMAGSGAATHVAFDVTGYLAAGSGGTTYVPVDGVRLLDTRTGNGLSGTFRSGVPRTFTIAGRGGVPANAEAVTANLVVVGQSAAGYASLGPTMTGSPSTSTLNVPKGDVRANNVTVKLNAGKLDAVWKSSSSGTAHLVLDVTGYFVAGSGGATFVAIDPVRVLDSRVANGLSGAFSSGAPRTFPSAGRGTVPVDAVAISGNLTVTGQTVSGYVSLGPTMTGSPSTSTLNVPKGDVRANGVTTKLGSLGTNGAVYVGGSGATHLVMDLTGYWR
jgi:spore germination protein YaaH